MKKDKMATKNNFLDIDNLEIEDYLIKVFVEFSQLKNIYRQGWLNNKVSKENCESVANHSFGVCILAYFIIQEFNLKFNMNKVLIMSLIHDVGEIYAEDITPKDNINNEEKFKREKKSATRVLSKLSKKNYLEIWLEFEKGETPEAKFVKEIDKLEILLQSKLYEKIGYEKLSESFSKNISKIKDPNLKKILKKILKLR